MQGRSKMRQVLIGVTAGVFIALAIWPSTGWLVRSHLRLTIPTSGRVAPWAPYTNVNAEKLKMETFREAAARRTGDFDVLFADAVSQERGPLPGSFQKAQQLRELAKRFPGRATLHAAILRFSTTGEVRVRRVEEGWLTGESVQTVPQTSQFPQNTPEQLAAYNRDAAEGERLDPDNAYFPYIRALGLCAAHRDTEALAAIKRASEKKEWREYYGDEVLARWKLAEEAYGKTGALPRMSIAFAIIFPHYAALRSVSRVAIAKAGEAELAGRTEEGLEIRQAVARCGQIMRVHSTSAIGSLVGIAITRMSYGRPGGAPPIPPKPRRTEGAAAERFAEERLRAYEDYLRKVGHEAEIARVRAEEGAGKAARAIIMPLSDSSMVNLGLLWITSLLLLSNATIMLAFGGFAALLARHRSIRQGTGWVRGAHGIWAIGVLLAGCALYALFSWQVWESTSPFVETAWAVIASTSGDYVYNGSQQRILVYALGAAVPCSTLLLLGFLSLVWRVPLSVGIVRGLRGLAVPMACGFLLGYSALVPFVVRQEAAVETALQRTIQHEGKYLAELAGKEWPE